MLVETIVRFFITEELKAQPYCYLGLKNATLNQLSEDLMEYILYANKGIWLNNFQYSVPG